MERGAGLDLFHPGRGFDDWIPILVGNSQQKIFNAKVQKQMLIGQQCFLIYRRQSGICGHPCRQMSTGYVIFSLNGGIGWYWSVGSYQMVVQGQSYRWSTLWSTQQMAVTLEYCHTTGFWAAKTWFLEANGVVWLYWFFDIWYSYVNNYTTDMWNMNSNNLLCVYIYIHIYRSNYTNRPTGPKYSLDYI